MLVAVEYTSIPLILTKVPIQGPESVEVLWGRGSVVVSG